MSDGGIARVRVEAAGTLRTADVRAFPAGLGDVPPTALVDSGAAGVFVTLRVSRGEQPRGVRRCACCSCRATPTTPFSPSAPSTSIAASSRNRSRPSRSPRKVRDVLDAPVRVSED
jgi:hypothetical protein